MSKPKILALITARISSERVKEKNFVDLGGKPLYQWTTDLKLLPELVNAIGFSSDKPDGFNIPPYIWKIQRPDNLCGDVPHAPVIKHGLEAMEELHGHHFDYVLLLQPTNPLRRLEDIRNFIDYCVEEEHDYGNTYYIDDNLCADYLPPVFRAVNPITVRSGSMYWYSRDTVFNLPSKCSGIAYEISKQYGYNINTPLDIEITRGMLKHIQKHEGIWR